MLTWPVKPMNAPSVIFEKNETEENQEFTDTEKEELKKAEESEESCEDDTVSKKEVAYNTSYIKAITNLQGTIKLKAPLICVTKEITEMLCDIMDKNGIIVGNREGDFHQFDPSIFIDDDDCLIFFLWGV